MSITPAALANHDALFPDHESTLKVTDPEFVELFDNFAFDEVIAHGNLPVPMYASSPPDQLHIQQYLSANCFGDYYTRTGLDVPTRELLIHTEKVTGSVPVSPAQITGRFQLRNRPFWLRLLSYTGGACRNAWNSGSAAGSWIRNRCPPS